MSAIGEAALLEAMTGHVARMGFMDNDIERSLIAEDISPDELRAAIGALMDQRDDGSVGFDREAYIAAALDGFMIGVRAARAAHNQEG